ncbi:immunity 53 family protein [Nocardia sp. NPDC058058]|uniref:immunity 53 family protein n=1 Tax=Nocardia sp. NPDC058058 TaxID=3346317 RepID=UPI0036DA616B
MSEHEHALDWLQSWYSAQCDGDREHRWGLRIETLDNPGWLVEINLEQTDLAERKNPRQQIDRNEHDWVHAWTAGQTFHLACGPRNLTEALTLFRVWVSARD